MSSKECGICYSADEEIVVCWNDHMMCGECYRHCMSSSRSQNKKCAFCREPMFRWGNGQQDPFIVPQVRPLPLLHHRQVASFRHIFAYRYGSNEYEERLETLHTDGFPDVVDPDRFIRDLRSSDVETDFPPDQWAMFERLRLSVATPNTPNDQLATLFSNNWIERRYPPRYRQDLEERFHILMCPDWNELSSYRSEWSMHKQEILVPLLHSRNRLENFGTNLSIANGGLVIPDLPHHSHPDHRFLCEVDFPEDQVFHSKNWQRIDVPNQPHHYQYVGKYGPWITPPNGGRRYRLPFPQKDCIGQPFRRCGHCKCVGHTATWELQGQGGVSRRVSRCPYARSKDYGRKERVDYHTFYLC